MPRLQRLTVGRYCTIPRDALVTAGEALPRALRGRVLLVRGLCRGAGPRGRGGGGGGAAAAAPVGLVPGAVVGACEVPDGEPS